MPNPVPAAETGLPAFRCDAELVRLGRELEEAARITRPEPQQAVRHKNEDVEFGTRIHRRLRRNLYSIMNVVGAMAGERADICRGYYLTPELDPFSFGRARQGGDVEEEARSGVKGLAARA